MYASVVTWACRWCVGHEWCASSERAMQRRSSRWMPPREMEMDALRWMVCCQGRACVADPARAGSAVLRHGITAAGGNSTSSSAHHRRLQYDEQVTADQSRSRLWATRDARDGIPAMWPCGCQSCQRQRPAASGQRDPASARPGPARRTPVGGACCFLVLQAARQTSGVGPLRPLPASRLRVCASARPHPD